jgi:hypothetical protein
MVDRTLKCARELLDATEAERVWSEGTAMSLDAAIAYALSQQKPSSNI